MRKKGRIVLLAVVLGLGTILLIRLWPSREPSYEGKPLSYWIATLLSSSTTNGFASAEQEEVVREAILKMGTTNAIPLLLKWGFDHSPVQNWIVGAFPAGVRERFIRFHPTYIRNIHRSTAACRALAILGAEASPALPRLGNLVVESQLFAGRALWVLSDIGEPAVPTMANAMAKAPPKVRYSILVELERLGSRATNALPTLTNFLNHPDPVVRSEAVRAIQEISSRPRRPALDY